MRSTRFFCEIDNYQSNQNTINPLHPLSYTSPPSMKAYFLACLLLILNLTLSAQCDRIIQLGQEALAAREYQLAIERLLDANDACPGRRTQINQLIKEAFAQIEGEKQKADSALAVANRVLDQLYFYEGKFGLTLKNVGSNSTPKYRYGFIDRKGNEVIAFEFEEATPFSVNDGFARVKQGGKKYLLNRVGTRYLLAESLAELTSDTEALDLHESRPDRLPEEIGDFSKLKIMLLYADYADEGKLSTLPESIGQLRQLQKLFLSRNQLSALPESIAQLSQLQLLYLGKNLIPPSEKERIEALRPDCMISF